MVLKILGKNSQDSQVPIRSPPPVGDRGTRKPLIYLIYKSVIPLIQYLPTADKLKHLGEKLIHKPRTQEDCEECASHQTVPSTDAPTL